ncbi:MAG: ZIP family metal transporter [Clostridia bacterium]|nr:ZIP family metal transporter [Clostridia bacterium]
MHIVWITAFGVGGATIAGSLLGFIFKSVSKNLGNVILSFAAGVMLAASIIGLVLPSLEYGDYFALPVTVAGIFAGALCVKLLDKTVPRLHKLAGTNAETSEQLNSVLLFVFAIAIHNLPEGIAAGVGFGTGNIKDALTVAGGIALQNLPEGMIIIAPMLSAGISPSRTMLCAAGTGIIEIIGTLIGYYAVTVSDAILPFALALAGGTMLYVISDEMIPATHSDGCERCVTFSLFLGFCVMLSINYYMS